MYNVPVAEPRRDDFPNNSVGDPVKTDRGVGGLGNLPKAGTAARRADSFLPKLRPTTDYRHTVVLTGAEHS